MIELNRQSISNTAKDVYKLCKTSNDLLQDKVNSDLSVAENVLLSFGSLAEDPVEKVSWQAVNQFTKAVTNVSLPRYKAGGRWLGQNRDFTTYSLVVDDVKKQVGGTCTIFQRMNEAGDMLRISTNVEKTGWHPGGRHLYPRCEPGWR